MIILLRKKLIFNNLNKKNNMNDKNLKKDVILKNEIVAVLENVACVGLRDPKSTEYIEKMANYLMKKIKEDKE